MPMRPSPGGGLPVLALVALLLAATSPDAAELRVTDDGGRPVPGASVTVLAPAATSEALATAQARVLLRGETDADGRVVTDLPEIGGLIVLIDEPGHLPRADLLPAPLPATVQLSDGLLLTGRARPVLRRRPPPKSGRACARWTETRPDGLRARWRHCAPLTADGGFTLRGLPSAEVELSLHADGCVPVRRRVVPGHPVELLLEPGVAIVGRVSSGHRAVPGATVEPMGGDRGETGRDGAFSVVAPRLPVMLSVDAPGYRPAQRLVRPPPPDHELEPIEIELRPGAELTAQLVAAAELPPEVELRLERFEPPSRWLSYPLRVPVERDGFRADLPQPGHYRLRVAADGFRETVVPAFDAPEGSSTDLGVLALTTGAGVTGWVSDGETGEGLSRADVEAVPQGARLFDAVLRGATPRTTSRGDGSFRLTGLESGEWEIRFRRDPRAPLALQVTLDEDRIEDLGEVRLGPGVAVRGCVVDGRGIGRSGVAVRFYAADAETWTALAEAWTEESGRFSGVLLAPGRYRVRVEGERVLLERSLDLGEAEREHELELRVGGVQIAGRVTRRGAPLSGGSISLLAAEDPGLRRGKLVLATGSGRQAFGLPSTRVAAALAADGSFRIPDGPAGTLQATVVELDGRSTVRRVRVPDSESAWVEIELEGSDLLGRVLARDDERPLDARVEVFPEGSALPCNLVHTAGDGTFRASGLEPGRYDLSVRSEGYAGAFLRHVSVPAGGPLTLKLDPAGGDGSLTVALRSDEGRPLASVPTVLVDPTGRVVRALLSGPDGRRRYEDLSPATYRLVWADPTAGVGISPPIAVAAGDNETSITSPRGTVLSVTCRSSGCEGARIEHLRVSTADGIDVAAQLPGWSPALRLARGGPTALGKLAPGDWRLEVVAGGLSWRGWVHVGSSPVTIPLD